MNWIEFSECIINDGIEAARFDYSSPSRKLHLDGSIKGFEECRNLSLNALAQLLVSSKNDLEQSFRNQESNYWYWCCRRAEIEWVCNVISAARLNMGLSVIIPPTARGMQKAANILGVKETINGQN